MSQPSTEAPAVAAGEDTRRRILDAALEVFSEHGYQGSSMRQIVRRAGLRSPAHLYFYFRNKADLFAQVTTRSATALPALEFDDAILEQPPERALRAFADAYIELFDDPAAARLMRIILAEAAMRPEVGKEYMRDVGRRALGFLERYFERHLEADAPRRPLAIWFLWQLVAYVELRELFTPLYEELPDRDAYLDLIVGRALHGLPT